MNKKNKKFTKAQIAGQVFIYMMAVIIVGAIAIIGYKAVAGISDKACQAEKATFNSNMIGMIEKYNSYGNVNPKSIKAPCDYDTICFVAASDIVSNSVKYCPNQIIRDSVSSDNDQNIFVISNHRTIPIGYSDLISLDPTYLENCLCISAKNKKFDVVFKGQGSTTEITTN